jgi:hypothetical protein
MYGDRVEICPCDYHFSSLQQHLTSGGNSAAVQRLFGSQFHKYLSPGCRLRIAFAGVPYATTNDPIGFTTSEAAPMTDCSPT